MSRDPAARQLAAAADPRRLFAVRWREHAGADYLEIWTYSGAVNGQGGNGDEHVLVVSERQAREICEYLCGAFGCETRPAS